MARGLFFRSVFIFNFLNVDYFSFLKMLGLVIHHFWWKEYFSRTPGSYRYTNSIKLVPRFGLWPSPLCDITHSYVWYDSFTYKTWLMCTCDMTRSHVQHDSFIRATWLIHACDKTHSSAKLHRRALICQHVTWLVNTCNMSRDSWIPATFSFLCVRHDSFWSLQSKLYSLNPKL